VRREAAAEQERRPLLTVLDFVQTAGAFAEADLFWIYWDTAWSIIISGIMVATIVAHPDADFAEVRSARRS
jgi:hypothetical protein